MTAGGATHLDSARGWVSACGAALSVMAAFGTIYSFNAFAKSMSEEFGTGHGPISLVFGITVFLFFGSAVVSGRFYDRFGIAPLLIVGGSMFCGGLFAMSHVSVLWHGYVLFGVGLGFGGGIFNAPLFALTAMWFARHRAVAQGLVATGSGLGVVLFAPLAQWLLEIYGWRGGMRVLAVLSAGIFAAALFMIKRPPKMEMGDPQRHRALVVRSVPFWQMAVSGVFFTAAVIGSLGSVVTFAQDDGLPARAAVALLTVIGFASVVGRMALTSMARPLGSVRLLKIAFFGLPVAFAVWFATTRVGGLEAKFVLLIVFASILGVSYGGFVALLGDVTAHLFGLAGIGAVMGLLFFSAGTGALIGPPLMGFTADATGGIGLSIAIAGVIAAVGVAVLLPMTRHPVPLPTYIGPPGAPPPPRPAPLAAEVPRPLVPQPSAAAPLAAPSSRPLAPRPLAAGGPNGKPAVPMIRPVDDPVTADPSLAPTTADPLLLSAPLRGAPPEVFWPLPADGAAQRNGLETPDLVVDVADEERDEARRN
ncbi:MFS transporter [Candidatus Poriferisodalis sp.]|uniref:MFS transporter n=1 Tax=Candidatus Poriferisodalis sp. TaxID=3101277 RepID=UPI003B02BA1C